MTGDLRRSAALALTAALLMTPTLAPARAEGLRGTFGAVPEGVAARLPVLAGHLRSSLARTARDIVPSVTMRKRDALAPTLAPTVLDGTLKGSVAAALRGSHRVEAARAGAEAALLRSNARALSFLPSLSFQSGLESAPDFTRGAVPGRDRISSASLDASVPIYTSGMLTHGWLEARLNAEAAAFNVDAARRGAALRGALAHVETSLRRGVLARMESHYRALSRLAGVAQALFAAGEVSRTDVAIARANLAAARTGLADARRMVRDAQSGLQARTRAREIGPLELAIDLPALPETEEAAVATALARDPATSSLARVAEAKAHGALAERGRYGPQVGLYGSYRSDLYRAATEPAEPEWKVGFKLTVPIVQPGAVSSVQAARLDAIEAGHEAREAAVESERNVRTLWSAHVAAAEKLEAAQAFAAHVDASVKGTQAEYEAGFRSIGDVLEARAKALQAGIDREVARHAGVSTRLRLAAAMGALDHPDTRMPR